MEWLVDNNVPRPVTRLLLDLGEDAVEVRDVLGPRAADAEIAQFATDRKRVIVTHDARFSASCLAAGIRHLWMRTREPMDAPRLRETIADVIDAFDGGALRVEVTRTVVRTHGVVP